MVRGFPLLLTALVLCTVSPVAMAGPEAGAAPALPGIAGTVVGPDGAPVVGAQVCIVGEETYLELIDGRLTPVRNGSEVPINITDEHGRYAFAKTPDLYLVVAVAREVGYGEVLASKEQPATDVKLSPWGRIEGLVMMGDKPAVGMKLDLDQARWDLGHFGERNKATTDAEGCFVIDHAMPGTVSVCRPVVRFSRYDSGFASLMAWLDPITVQAGTTTRCTLDAQVLRVRGRVVLPEGLAAGDANVLAILWNLDAPPMPTRPEELLMPDAAALRAWRLSDAGRQYYRELAAEAAVLRNFVADALPDMTLQARGMPPGRYALTVLASRPGDQKTDEELDHAIRQIISKSMVSEGVVDIFAAAGLKTPDISILSDEFLAEVRGMPQRNLAVELLQKLLKGEIRARARRNVVQARSFADLLEQAVRKYQNRAVETAQVIEALIALAKDMRAANARGEALKLTEDELAFYDALEVNDSAVKVLGEPTLVVIARELVATVKKNVTIDWTVRDNVRAQLRVIVKRILRKHGYPPDKQEKATQTVLEQAEVLSEQWAAQSEA
jgi:hypothetical protein